MVWPMAKTPNEKISGQPYRMIGSYALLEIEMRGMSRNFAKVGIAASKCPAETPMAKENAE